MAQVNAGNSILEDKRVKSVFLHQSLKKCLIAKPFRSTPWDRLFMAVAPFSQRIQRGSQIGVGNGSIEESIDQSILPDNHHPVR